MASGSNPNAWPGTVRELDPAVVPADLRTEDDSGLIASGLAAPRVSWKLKSHRPSVRQLGYQIQVSSGPEFAGSLEETPVVESDRVALNPWPATPFRSRETRWWRVRVLTDAGLTDWSRPARVEAALLSIDDWLARPISLPSDVGRATLGPVPIFRRDFVVDRQINQARLYVTSLGILDIAVNGQRVTSDMFEPGWTSYGHRVLYATYDVAALLTLGRNAISAVVGDGWYRGTLTWLRHRNVYGNACALLAQLEIDYVGVGRLTVKTDQMWRASTGCVRSADFYDGSDIDFRLEPRGWRLAGFADDHWEPVVLQALPRRLEQRGMPAIRAIATMAPSVERMGESRIRVDAGRNIAGYLRFQAEGAAGSVVAVRHAEVLDDNGELFTASLGTARALDKYILGSGPTTLEPAFTFHGFRHAEIEFGSEVSIDSIDVVVIGSDLAETGWFECSEPLVDALYENIRWSQRGNFIGIPTDCPQRDERLGWTADIQVFAPVACTNTDARTFLASWLTDLRHDQRSDGAVANVVPNALRGERIEYGAGGWGDAAAVVPWVLYETYGDIEILSAQFQTMRAWVDWAAGRCGHDHTWRGDHQFGDWLDPAAPIEDPSRGVTPSDFIATAYLAYSADIVARTAGVLGRDDDRLVYRELRDIVASAAWHLWADDAIKTQSGCAIALELGIAPPHERDRVGNALAELVRKADGRVETGFLGTPHLLPALSATGHVDEAYQVLLNRRCPGWLYEVLHGATTVWESWDAIHSDGTVNKERKNALSFNHVALGAVATWLYRSVAGIRPDPSAPGYRNVLFTPEPGGGLTHATAHIETPYGHAAISWKVEADDLHVDVSVPAGSSARLVVPGGWRLVRGATMLGSGAQHLYLTRSKPAH